MNMEKRTDNSFNSNPSPSKQESNENGVRSLPVKAEDDSSRRLVAMGLPVVETRLNENDDDDDRQMVLDEVRYLREELENGVFIPKTDGDDVTADFSRSTTLAPPIVEEEEPANTNRKRKVRIVVLALLLVTIIAIAVTLGIVFGENNDNGGSSSTTAVSNTATKVQQLIHSVAFDSGTSLEDPTSPQSRALAWLQHNNTFLDSFTETELIQRFVLATLYFSTNGDGWREKSRWLGDESVCGWYNMDIDRCNDGGGLAKLSLDSNYLNGTLPPELGLLSDSLVRASFFYNYLSGTVPTEIGLMRRLEQLFFSENLLIGTIPTQVGELHNMKELFFDRNDMFGTIPSEIGLLTTHLGRLLLFDNSFSGSIPSELGGLPRLQMLRIGNNRFTGSIPTEIGLLTNRFSWFDVHSNALTGTIPNEIRNLVKLEKMLLQNNRLNGTIPEGINRLPFLRELKLYNNSLTGNFTCDDSVAICMISCGNTSVACRSLE